MVLGKYCARQRAQKARVTSRVQGWSASKVRWSAGSGCHKVSISLLNVWFPSQEQAERKVLLRMPRHANLIKPSSSLSSLTAHGQDEIINRICEGRRRLSKTVQKPGNDDSADSKGRKLLRSV